MLFGITACVLLFVITSAGITDISSSDHLLVSFKALFVICKDPSLSDSALILFVCLELILVLLVDYATRVLFFI